MATKLTLRLDEELIQRAKAFAKKRGKSVSQLVAEYFLLLDKPSVDPPNEAIGPLTQSLKGVLEGANVGEEDYYRHLEEKYL